MVEVSIHEGNNLRRIREILQMKQDTLALKLSMSQQAVSAMERRPVLGEALLQKLSTVLGVPPIVVRHFNDQRLRSFLVACFVANDMPASSDITSSGTLWVRYLDLIEENRRLYQELIREKEEKRSIRSQASYNDPGNSSNLLVSEPLAMYYSAN